jgi:hypothetical protein
VKIPTKKCMVKHLFCHASGRDVTILQLKLFVVDQVYHGLEGISLQIPSDLGQPPTECLSCSMYRPYSQSQKPRMPRKPEASSNWLPFQLQQESGALEEIPASGIGDRAFRGVLAAAVVEGPILSLAIPIESSDSMSISSRMCWIFKPRG